MKYGDGVLALSYEPDYNGYPFAGGHSVVTGLKVALLSSACLNKSEYVLSVLIHLTQLHPFLLFSSIRMTTITPALLVGTLFEDSTPFERESDSW